MNKYISFSLLLIFTSCNTPEIDINENKNHISTETGKVKTNLLTDIIPLHEDGDVNAIIEIPSGTLEKWELNKSSGQVEREFVNDIPRTINYLGYPGNYGMIPRTLLSKEQGGDGDPLDIIVLGPPVERSSIIKCKIIGVLYLKDRGEQDDKLVAVSANSPLYEVNDLEELKEGYIGILDIIELWFANYKGPGKMESKGYGDKKSANGILEAAIKEYRLNKNKHNKK